MLSWFPLQHHFNRVKQLYSKKMKNQMKECPAETKNYKWGNEISIWMNCIFSYNHRNDFEYLIRNHAPFRGKWTQDQHTSTLFHSSLSSLASSLSFHLDVVTGRSYTSPKGRSNAALFSSVKGKPAEDSFIASIVSRILSP